MITLRENEKVLLTIHRHWIVMFFHILLTVVLGALPFLLFLNADNILIADPTSRYPLALLVGVFWWLFLLFFFFLGWLRYWLNALIITDARVIDIRQRGLFGREVSEFMVSRIENVTVETPNALAAILKFGTIVIETAGEANFKAELMPDLDRARNIIMDSAQKE